MNGVVVVLNTRLVVVALPFIVRPPIAVPLPIVVEAKIPRPVEVAIPFRSGKGQAKPPEPQGAAAVVRRPPVLACTHWPLVKFEEEIAVVEA